jgi:hypothetical protein
VVARRATLRDTRSRFCASASSFDASRAALAQVAGHLLDVAGRERPQLPVPDRGHHVDVQHVAVPPLRSHVAGLALGIAGLTWITSAVAFTLAEDVGQDGRIESFLAALWWSSTTITTVGYGDIARITTVGRIIGVMTMVVVISTFAVVTARIAQFSSCRSARREPTQAKCSKVTSGGEVLSTQDDDREDNAADAHRLRARRAFTLLSARSAKYAFLACSARRERTASGSVPSGSTPRSKRSIEALRALAVRAEGSAVLAQERWAAARARSDRSEGVMGVSCPSSLHRSTCCALPGLPPRQQLVSPSIRQTAAAIFWWVFPGCGTVACRVALAGDQPSAQRHRRLLVIGGRSGP